uniref:Major facilitator superfamily (MFS) profile domain-containing protein n=1 Tax=Haptolina brevifila TaxID=156173 RepID=A0A7S2J3R0_9EUKA
MHQFSRRPRPASIDGSIKSMRDVTTVLKAKSTLLVQKRHRLERLEAERDLDTLMSFSEYRHRTTKRHVSTTKDDPQWLRQSEAARATVPNGGYLAWRSVAGYALVCLSTLGLQYAYSAIYPALLDSLNDGPMMTALVGSLCAGMMEAFAVPTALLIARIGPQRTCVVGCALSVIGMVCSAECNRAWQLLLTHGLLTGVGHSLAFFSPIVLMARARRGQFSTTSTGASSWLLAASCTC